MKLFKLFSNKKGTKNPRRIFGSFLRSKKGESVFEVAETSIFYVVIMTVIVMIIIAFVFFLGIYTNKLTKTPEKLTAEIISLRFTNIPECFAYQDIETGRVYSGIIDLEKFNEQQMNDCYFPNPEESGHEEYNFRLQLASKLPESVKTSQYFNIDHFTLNKKVVVKDGDNFFTDTLIIFVQARPKL